MDTVESVCQGGELKKGRNRLRSVRVMAYRHQELRYKAYYTKRTCSSGPHTRRYTDPITPHALPELVSRRWSSAIDEIPRITLPVRLTTEKHRKQAGGRLLCYSVIADYRFRRETTVHYSISANYK